MKPATRRMSGTLLWGATMRINEDVTQQSMSGEEQRCSVWRQCERTLSSPPARYMRWLGHDSSPSKMCCARKAPLTRV